ncbi:D-serine ammonia-lyase [Thauera sp. SDU_THAU2]|uniref:D-serine ammonia-lyase n=1 Tax=Thauera sp. SDU_THAU2 TaxID=3136633 RepID=UPI00311DAACD
MNTLDYGLSPELVASLQNHKPLCWFNPAYPGNLPDDAPTSDDVKAAEIRLHSSSGLLSALFPELGENGCITSPLKPVPQLQKRLAGSGTWLLKADHALPVAGSIKARGGFHEVLAYAQSLASDAGICRENDLSVLKSAEARALFSQHAIAVGSTGNLGLAIGVIAAALGFRTVVHMSTDAKEWKKERLRRRGVEVIEHAGDYGAAVDAGRATADADPHCHFVDDENSRLLFLGYAAAARELAAQLAELNRPVDADHPLFVYLPCGVGGAPGGITFGLKAIFGAHVHCFFAEPTASPCMLLRLAAGRRLPVYEIGLDNRTEADGLAVGDASPLVAPLMAAQLSGVFTVTDDDLFRGVAALADTESIAVEPSAAAALPGPEWICNSSAGREYLVRHGLMNRLDDATHVLWSTGGSLVPANEYDRFLARGHSLLSSAKQ